MTRHTLTSPHGAIDDLARLYLHQDHASCTLSVREDRAFSVPDFFPLGTIDLFPQGPDLADYTRALRHGHFEWRTPALASASAVITELLRTPTNAGSRAPDKIHRILDSIGAVPVRLGLAHPTLDPHALATMPFSRPTTVVTDTSGVLQGGLSFVSRYLYPAARVKVPAIVQTEIVNLADRFISIRRASKPKPLELLLAHLNSQAGQRVLLQLELHSDVELERTFLFGDPLRGAFTHDRDRDLAELNLNVPFRSYVDRLILEAARRHQSQVAVGHPVTILTSDQGLARMALAEGMRPLYFRATTAAAFFGRRLTGTTFHPFSGAIASISVPGVLWELATIFGSARLAAANDAARHVTVHAIGEDLTWAPYHSHDDLLWLELPTGDRVSPPGAAASGDLATADRGADGSSGRAGRQPRSARDEAGRRDATQTTRASASRYKYSVTALVKLVDRLDTQQELRIGGIMEILGVRTASGLKDYRRFLQSGQAITIGEERWLATPRLSDLAIALRNGDIKGVRAALGHFPSYAVLANRVEQQPIGVPVDSDIFGRSVATLTAWAEITELGAHVHSKGFFATPTVPDSETFGTVAMTAYEEVRGDGPWVATGRWLEQLIVGEGIHPSIARVLVQTASAAGAMRAIVEGSTTETQYDKHSVKVLDVEDGVPVVKTEYLYRGDFLIPGQSSSSVRIERTTA